MFALGPRHAGGDQRRLGVEELRLRGDDVGLGGSASVILVLGDRQRMLVLDDRLFEQVFERIGFSQRHIGERQQRLLGKRGVGEGSGAHFRARLLRLDLPPYLPPNVERPHPRGFGGQGRELGRAALSGTGPVDGRKEPGARLVDERQRLAIVSLVRLDRLIGHGDDSHEPIELRISKNGPPFAFWLVRPRRRGLPAFDLVKLRRHDRRRPLEVGADRRAVGKRERKHKSGRGRPVAGQRRAPAKGVGSASKHSRFKIRPLRPENHRWCRILLSIGDAGRGPATCTLE